MNTCVIEALYPEVCNLFGDTGNLRYLKLCLPQATFIETALNDEPYFVHHPVSMIYLGPMSEHTQCTVISKLAPYWERIAECIANGVTFLATGNAMEVFGKQITDAQSGVTTGLGLIDLTTTRDMMHRFYSLVLGTYNELQMVGFRAQFTRSTLGSTEVPFIQVTKGTPMCETARIDGIQKNHFYGTYCMAAQRMRASVCRPEPSGPVSRKLCVSLPLACSAERRCFSVSFPKSAASFTPFPPVAY